MGDSVSWLCNAVTLGRARSAGTGLWGAAGMDGGQAGAHAPPLHPRGGVCTTGPIPGTWQGQGEQAQAGGTLGQRGDRRVQLRGWW